MTNPRSSFRYQPFYCEENVWWLTQADALLDRSRWITFVTNPNRACAFSHQLVAKENETVIWDYHVVLLTRTGSQFEIWDLDTRLGFPTAATTWLEASFPLSLPEIYQPIFRIVEHETFMHTFATDRRHMRDSSNLWKAPAPSWPTISTANGAQHTLDIFLNVDAEGPGEVATLTELKSRVGT